MSRAAKIEAAAREILASGGYGMPVGTWERLVAALALPADPVSVDARERALVREALDADFFGTTTTESAIDAVLRAVNVTHPRAPSVEAASELPPLPGLVERHAWADRRRLDAEHDAIAQRARAEAAEEQRDAAYERGREDAARVCDAAAQASWCESDGERTEEERVEHGRMAVALDRLAARIRTLAPVAQVAPSEAAGGLDAAMATMTRPQRAEVERLLRLHDGASQECERLRRLLERSDDLDRALVNVAISGHEKLSDADADKFIAAVRAHTPIAPRDQGGGLREWVHRAMSAAWDIGYDAKHGDGVLAGETERARESDLAFLLGPAGDLGPPPTDGVAAAYERLRAAAEAFRDDEDDDRTETQDALYAALAAPVSEKERAK